MVPKSKTIWLLSFMVMGLVIAGCRSQSLDVPTPLLDLEATEKENAQRTEAVSTLSAAMTREARQAVLTASAPAPTLTLAPTRTATATFTNTPFLENSFSTTTSPTPQMTAPLLLSPTEAIPERRCNLIKTTPAYRSILVSGESFETHWVLLNSGSETWYDNIGIQYRNGVPMHTNDGKMSILSAVKPGELYEVVVPMKAPLEAGFYTSVWILTFKKEAFCWFSVDIEVQ